MPGIKSQVRYNVCCYTFLLYNLAHSFTTFELLFNIRQTDRHFVCTYLCQIAFSKYDAAVFV